MRTPRIWQIVFRKNGRGRADGPTPWEVQFHGKQKTKRFSSRKDAEAYVNKYGFRVVGREVTFDYTIYHCQSEKYLTKSGKFCPSKMIDEIAKFVTPESVPVLYEYFNEKPSRKNMLKSM